MSLMMYPVLIVLCVGIVLCEDTERPSVTVTPVAVTSTTPISSDSTSRVIIENKVQNLTVEYNSDHGRNTTYVVNRSGDHTTEKPLIISTSKEMRLIQAPPLNDSIATATTHSKTNGTRHHPKEIKHHARANNQYDHFDHFLPTIRPEPPTKSANHNSTKVANPKGPNPNGVKPKGVNQNGVKSKSTNPANQTVSLPSNHNDHQSAPSHSSQVKTLATRQVQHVKPTPHYLPKSLKKTLSHASEVEMEKVEMKEVRYIENPKDNEKFRFYMAAEEEPSEKLPSTSSQMFEMTFPSKAPPRASSPGPKQMDKYMVRSKPYYNNNQNYQNTLKPIESSTPSTLSTPPLQYMTPPPATIYTVRPKTTIADNISITTYAPAHKKFNVSHHMGPKVHPHSGPRDFSCLRCYGNNKPQKNYKYPSYPSKHDPMLDGNRAVTLLGPEGDNFLGGSKHHFVMAKPEAPRQTNTTSSPKGQKPVNSQRPDAGKTQEKPKSEPKRPQTAPPVKSNVKKPNVTAKRPEVQNLKGQPQNPKGQPQNLKNPYADGLANYGSHTKKRPETYAVPKKPSHSTHKQKEDPTARPQSSPKTRSPYLMDGFIGNYASSTVGVSATKSNIRTTVSPFKLDPTSDLYNLDEELQASASSMHKHHPDVKVETKEIHIPVPEIIETRVPYPIHVKVDRLVPVHIDKPYPVHVEKKVPVPVKINVPQPYPVEKEVPYPVKIPIEVPRPVEVSKPIPYLVETPVPVQVFKQVKVPVKVPVDVPKPYKVHVQVEKRVPYFVEKKVPFEVPVPVEKPYLVEVKKPFEVPQEKPQPVTVEKKIPVPVQVVEFIKVPIPTHPGQHSYQQRLGKPHQNKMTSQNDEMSYHTRFVEIPIESDPNADSESDEQSSSTNHQQKRLQVYLPRMISVEFPSNFDHQPTGPASGFLPTASDSQETQK